MKITCRVKYSATRRMWRVAVYRDGRRTDEWFHTESFARLYAAWREALG